MCSWTSSQGLQFLVSSWLFPLCVRLSSPLSFPFPWPGANNFYLRPVLSWISLKMHPRSGSASQMKTGNWWVQSYCAICMLSFSRTPSESCRLVRTSWAPLCAVTSFKILSGVWWAFRQSVFRTEAFFWLGMSTLMGILFFQKGCCL